MSYQQIHRTTCDSCGVVVDSNASSAGVPPNWVQVSLWTSELQTITNMNVCGGCTGTSVSTLLKRAVEIVHAEAERTKGEKRR